MEKIINACGLTCPAPVLLVKDAVEQLDGDYLTVLVDNEPSLENVSRFLGSKGYSVESHQDEDTYKIIASIQGNVQVGQTEQNEKKQEQTADQQILVMITTDRLGSGDDELGLKLMISYIKTLKEMGPELWQIVFLNGGVKLTIGSSPVLQELQEYEKSGITILTCGTCLEHFNLTSEKQVGTTTNMLDIVMATELAGKVVTIS